MTLRTRDGEQQYSIGNPTDEEQLFVEYINRARADAEAEAQRLRNTDDPDVLSSYDFYKVNLDQMVTQFATLPRTLPPLSINAKLASAARLHSQDMFNNAFQGHFSSSSPIPPNQPSDDSGSRIDHQGYDYSAVAENVYSYADSVRHAHTAFEVDWGNGSYGMQSPPGHRENIHDTDMRELGVGVVLGTNSTNGNQVGPVVITQDFGTQQNESPFITGVAYFDLNGNSFYDVGEGIGGVRVSVIGSSYYAETAASGGFSVPVTDDDTYQVTFSGLGFAPPASQAAVSDGENAKLDFTPTYSAATVSGTTTPPVGSATVYSFTKTPGATTYSLRQGALSDTDWREGAENGTAGMTIEATASYDVLSSQSTSAGSSAFHLAHPELEEQSVRFNAVFIPSDTSQLRFAKRLAYAGPGQQARVELSTDPALSWTTIWSQSGDNTAGESSFSTRDVSLAGFAGQTVQLRFVYDFSGGQYYSQTGPNVGFFFDEVTVTNADWAGASTITTLGGVAEFEFSPAVEGSYFLQVRAGQANRDYLFGAPLVVDADPLVFGLDVGPGWNMLSIPRQLPDGQDAVTTLFPDVESAWTWTGSGYAKADTLTPLVGHWILHGATGKTVQVTGTKLDGTPVDLTVGWNCVGVPARSAKPTAPDIRGKIWFWNSATQTYQAVPDDGPDAFLFPGTAYWVDATAAFRLYP